MNGLDVTQLDREGEYNNLVDLHNSDQRNTPQEIKVSESGECNTQLEDGRKLLKEQNDALSAKLLEQERIIDRLTAKNKQLFQENQRHHQHARGERELERECVICKDERKVIVFIPCGHLCSCEACASSLSECPVCRAQTTLKCKTYM